MRVVVLSDVHGELENVSKLISRLRELKPDLVVHLGDDYGDAGRVAEEGFRLVRVPGVFEELYRRLDVANRLLINLEGWLTLLTHSEKRHENDLSIDPDPEELVRRGSIDLLLHGHTHTPRVERVEGVVFVNPGHLKKQDKKGYPPTYASLELEAGRLRVEVAKLYDGEPLIKEEFWK